MGINTQVMARFLTGSYIWSQSDLKFMGRECVKGDPCLTALGEFLIFSTIAFVSSYVIVVFGCW
jgi:hypothetical protein